MSTSPSAANLVAAEQEVIAVMRTEEQKIRAYIESCPIGGSAAAIGQWVQGFDNFFWNLLQFVPSTQSLKQQGHPAASQYLEAFAKEFAGAQQKCAQIYENTVAIQSEWSGIWRDANQFTIDTISQVVHYRQAVFDNWCKGGSIGKEHAVSIAHRLK